MSNTQPVTKYMFNIVLNDTIVEKPGLSFDDALACRNAALNHLHKLKLSTRQPLKARMYQVVSTFAGEIDTSAAMPHAMAYRMAGLSTGRMTGGQNIQTIPKTALKSDKKGGQNFCNAENCCGKKERKVFQTFEFNWCPEHKKEVK